MVEADDLISGSYDVQWSKLAAVIFGGAAYQVFRQMSGVVLDISEHYFGLITSGGNKLSSYAEQLLSIPGFGIQLSIGDLEKFIEMFGPLGLPVAMVAVVLLAAIAINRVSPDG